MIHYLMQSMLGKNLSRQQLEIFFFIYPDNSFDISANCLLDMTKSNFWEKNKKQSKPNFWEKK